MAINKTGFQDVAAQNAALAIADNADLATRVSNVAFWDAFDHVTQISYSGGTTTAVTGQFYDYGTYIGFMDVRGSFGNGTGTVKSAHFVPSSYDYTVDLVCSVNVGTTSFGGTISQVKYLSNDPNGLDFTVKGSGLSFGPTGFGSTSKISEIDVSYVSGGHTISMHIEGDLKWGFANSSDSVSGTIKEYSVTVDGRTVELSGISFPISTSASILYNPALLTTNFLEQMMAGNDVVASGADNQVLEGHAGNDTYIITHNNVTIVEVANGGIDIVQSSRDYTLGDNVENLTLTGVANLSGTGNALNNTITGNSGNNTLTGGGGVDTLKGGAGNDKYIVDLLQIGSGPTATVAVQDSVVELANQGLDTVTLVGDFSGLSATSTLTLGANLEILDASGTADTKLNLTGNALNNTLIGNAASNVLDGGVGADVLNGGAGDDTYFIDNVGDVIVEVSGEGVDLVKSTISVDLSLAKFAEVENATLLGVATLNLTGSAANNELTGNDGANIIDGGVGADTMAGGKGNDTYVVDNAGDTVTEGFNAGVDLVKSSVDFELGANLESLTLTGSGNINGTGNNLANVITGNSGNNTLDGYGGIDTLQGGLGDDTYIVDLTKVGTGAAATVKLQDTVTELVGQGVDTIILAEDEDGNYADVIKTSTLVLGANIDNIDAALTNLTSLNITGNVLNNVITGNAADNVLDGGVGNDTLYGGAGNDTLIGGAGSDALIGGTGSDIYILDSASDTVTENSSEGNDTIKIGFGVAGGSVSLASAGVYAHVENATLTNTVAFNLSGSNANNILIGNAAANTLNGGLGDDSLYGGLGVDTLNGGDGNDTLDGGVGADVLNGGAGDDTYFIDNVGDVITDGAGDDTINSTISVNLATQYAGIENATLLGTAVLNLTGNAGDNELTGNDGANIIDGGVGADTMAGGKGNDTYVVDNAGDTVTEGFNAGVDLVKSSVDFELGANLESLTLTGSGNINGTGNNLANVIIGNSGNNTLTGGGGIDTLQGGLGDDIYNVDLVQVGTGAAATVKLQDTVTELAGQGTDAIVLQGDFSGLNTISTLVLGANIEILDASGTGDTKLNVTGNALNNILQGNHAANVLDGGAGNDILDGDEGADKLLGGLGNDTLYGDQGEDTLDGGAGNDRLEGGAGVDTLKGGAGNDVFVFNPGESINGSIDVITDFSFGDKIMLAGFAGVFADLSFDNESKVLSVDGSGTSFDGTKIQLTGFSGPLTESMFAFNTRENESAGYTDISADQAIDGNLSTYQDIDKYKITLGADDVMQLRFDVPGADAAASVSSFKVSVSDSMGNVLNSWLVAADSTLTLPTGIAGDYYVSVTGTDAAHYRGDFYTLTAQTQNSTPLTVDAASTTGNISATGEVDTYSVELVAGHTYNFDVSGETTSNGAYGLWNPKMTLWGPDGQQLAVSNDVSYTNDGQQGIVLDPHLAFTAPLSGTYTVAIGAGKLIDLGEDLLIQNGAPTTDTHNGKGSYGLSVSEMSLSEQNATMLDNVQWGDAVRGDSVTIYYDFQTADINPQSTNIGNPNYGYSNISAFGSALQTQAHLWLAEWENVSGVNFIFDNSQATLHFALGDGANGSTGSAWRYDSNGMSLWGTSGPTPQLIATADVTLTKQLEVGESYYHLFQHEVGHALGLTHPAEYAFNTRFNPEAPLGLGNDDFTIMSYNDTASAGDASNQGLRLLDIAAIQDLYGANMQYQVGDTTWAFNDKNHAYKMAIWDAGGIDTIDAGGQTLDSVINLTPGTLSSIGIFEVWADVLPGELAAVTVPGEMADKAYGNVGIAFGAHIENATGGSGNDYISGNDLDNVLKGNGGADRLNGGAGNDTLIGGAGNDILIGGLGSDTFRFELSGGVDTVRDFVSGTDKLEFYDLLSPDSANELDGLLEAAFGTGATATTTDQRILYDQSTGNLYHDDDGSAAHAAVLIASLGVGTTLTFEDISARNSNLI